MSDDNETTIRQAVAADAATVHALTKSLAKSAGAAERMSSVPGDFLKYGFSDSPYFETLIAEKDGTPVGLCTYFYTFSSWRGEPGVYVQDLYVSGEDRGTGLGKRLLAETVRRGAEKGATHLRLCVDHNNDAAKEFYLAVGMH